MTDFPPRRHQRVCRLSLLAAGLAGILINGCGGEAATTVPAPAAPDAHVAPANPAPVAPSTPSEPRGSRSAAAPTAAPLRALPEGAARYAVVPPAGGDGVAPVDHANFVLTGRTAGPEDAVRVGTLAEMAGADGRFTLRSVPPPPTGEPVGAAPDGFEVLSAAGAGAGGLPLRMRSKIDGMVLCLVPAGTVRLGTYGREQPRPQAFVSAFYMDEHEVTVGQFRRFLEESGERTEPPINMDAADDLPALGMSWRSAFLYARWAGRSLPTEAEWVRAVRGDDDFRYPWGHAQPVFAGGRDAGQIDPVMSFRTDRSPFGIYDLAGNAGEWTLQTFADDPLRGERTDASGLYRNPDRGLGAGGIKTVRGLGEGWSPDRRVGRDAQKEVERVGFRCVWRLTIDGTPGGDPLPIVAGGSGA